MPYGDSSYFVAISDARDQWHAAARKASRHMPRRLTVRKLVIAESVSIIGSRKEGKAARTLYEFFRDSTRIEFASLELLEAAMAHHVMFDGALSVSDCLTIAAMANAGDRSVVSFDSDIDKVRGVTQIH